MAVNARFFFVAALALVALLQTIPEGTAECCYGYTLAANVFKCGDCSKPTPFCAYGRCNIFGCFCDGGCRTGSCQTRKRRSLNPDDVVAKADMDGDGKLNLEEAESLLADHGIAVDHFKRIFKKMDRNNDNFLSPREIDSDFSS